MSSKRGQITLFIIIGIIILFSLGFTIYLLQKPEFKLTPKEELPIETYVKECIELTGREGIELLGTQGGYIEIPDYIDANPDAYLSFIPFGRPRIPYWYYEGKSRIPTDEMMQEQISDYVAERVSTCLGDFGDLKNDFEITKTGNATGESVIGDDSVLIKLNYPLSLKDRVSGSVLELEDFTAEIDVGLGRTYRLAKEILNAENKQTYFENMTLEMMSMVTSIPFTGFEFGCTPKIWRKSEIADTIQELLYYHIPRMRIKQTSYDISFTNDEKFEKHHFIWDIETENYKNQRVVFSYLKDWDFEIHVRPDDTELLKSNAGQLQNQVVPIPICMNTWHFTYDIIYPILTTINDEKSFNGDGFVFNFAFPVQINHNQGDRADFPITLYRTPDYSYGFCSNLIEPEYDIRVRDYYTYEELSRANVTFKCGRFVCDMGQTRAQEGSYKLKTELPAGCTGGRFTASKEGYLETTIVNPGPDFIQIDMKPLKKFDLSVEIYDSLKYESIKLRDEYTIFITLEDQADDHNIYMSYPAEKNLEIELVYGDAEYDVDILMVKGEEIRGGYKGKLETSYASMVNSEELVIKVLEIKPTPVEDKDQFAALNYLETNEEYKDKLKPVFK